MLCRLGTTISFILGTGLNSFISLLIHELGTYHFGFYLGVLSRFLSTWVGGEHGIQGTSALTTMLTKNGLDSSLHYGITYHKGQVELFGRHTTSGNTILRRILGVSGITIVRVLYGVVHIIRISCTFFIHLGGILQRGSSSYRIL